MLYFHSDHLISTDETNYYENKRKIIIFSKKFILKRYNPDLCLAVRGKKRRADQGSFAMCL
jgi:hypothetical protein